MPKNMLRCSENGISIYIELKSGGQETVSTRDRQVGGITLSLNNAGFWSGSGQKLQGGRIPKMLASGHFRKDTHEIKAGLLFIYQTGF
jgi:hypothetical protein